MTLGSLTPESRVQFYVTPRMWSAAALRALAVRTGEAEGRAVWQDGDIDAFVNDDRSQWWEQRWLASYRTVLIERTQTLQRQLNNLYSQQLYNALTRPIGDDPNYSMANLARMGKDPTGTVAGPQEGVSGADASLFSMSEAFYDGGMARSAQDPLSYAYGIPPETPPPAGYLTGPDWAALEQGDFGAWVSRQYQSPDMPLTWPDLGSFFHWRGSAEDVAAPAPVVSGRFDFGLGYFDLQGFVAALMGPLLYPVFFQRLETFAHSDVSTTAIDAADIRSDYQFRLKGLSDFPVLGPAMGAVLGLMSAAIGTATGVPGSDIAQALDLFLHAQPWVGAPQDVETSPGAFFATTEALQDWGLQSMDYQYFAAARYQQDTIDTDMLTAFRKAGASALKPVINALLVAAPPIKALTTMPVVSGIYDSLLSLIMDNVMNLVVQPVRNQIELDTQYEHANYAGDDPTTPGVETDAPMAEVHADNAGAYHIGDPPGLFGLVGAWEPAGFAAGYGLTPNATNRTEINQVEILTKRHTLTDLWDGQGVASDQHALASTTYNGVSSRLVAVGLQAQNPLNLAQFRYNVNAGTTTGNGLASYDRTLDDYKLSATTLLGNRIQVGSNVLAPSFGGGVRMTDLDTTRLDSFFRGSIAFAPRYGDSRDVYPAGTDVAGHPDAVFFDPASGLTGSNAGSVTFDRGADGILRYGFAAVPAGPDGKQGLRVTYRGQSALMADGITPQNVTDARNPDNYQVTDRNGQPITAEVITADIPAQVTAKLPSDWDYPANPLVTAPTAPGEVDLDLGARITAAPQQAVTSQRDTDSGHINASRLVFISPQVVGRLRQSPLLFGTEGTPSSGGEFQILGNAAVNYGNLADPGNLWTDWDFVAQAGGVDYNHDGNVQAGSLVSSGNAAVIESPSAIKEATHAWGDLIKLYVPAAFRRESPILTGNDAAGQPYPPEVWNTNFESDFHNVGNNSDGQPIYAGNPPLTYSATNPPPATATNPYFWTGADGYQYITIWDGAVTSFPPPLTPDQMAQNGLPDPNGTPPAHILAVLRKQPNADKIDVLSDGTAALLHRETQLVTVPGDLADAMFADLLAQGYTQGASGTDTSVPPLYDLARNPLPDPPPGTPGDFTIISGSPGGPLQVAFTKPYDGLVTVPPNRDSAGNPVTTWESVNGWRLSNVQDSQPAQGWSGEPANRLQVSASHPGMIWGANIYGQQDGTDGHQVPDRITVSKTVTVGTPTSADSGFTGDVLPGEGIAITLSGANTGPANSHYQRLSNVRAGTSTGNTLDTAVAFFPDRFEVTVTNANGTVTVPALKSDPSSDLPRPQTDAEAVGMETVTVPSDLLTGGDNTISVKVVRGGIYQRFCRSEQPSDQTDAASQLQAGFWVNTVEVTDRDGTIWPPGNLFYENRMVGDGSGHYQVFNDSDVIVRNDGPLPGFIDNWVPIEVNALAWKPDSYDPTRHFEGQLIPVLFAVDGGYQLKSDIRAGLTISTDPAQQTVHTFATETVDRYRYDPATQQILDVLPPVPQAQAVGPLWQGGPDGHRAIPAIVPPSDGHRNEDWYTDHYVPDSLVTSGQNPVANATVGSKIDRTNRQVFGSDGNLLLRTLYAAMKIVDTDGADGQTDPGDARLYREYRDAFNMGYLDHLSIVASVTYPGGGGISSAVEVKWRPDGDGRIDNDYRQNYEYYANEADREQHRYTTKRQAEILMNSYDANR